MECKSSILHAMGIPDKYWNISRMECKYNIQQATKDKAVIGIYPEWNVNII